MKTNQRLDQSTILFFADHWDDMWRRRQQLAWRLAENRVAKHVVYIERPLYAPSLLKYLAGRADLDGTTRWRRVLDNRSWRMPVSERFSVLTTFAPLPPSGGKAGFRFSERARDRWVLRHLRRLRRDGVRLDQSVVWISHPQLSVDVIRALEPSLLWYDCTEDFSDWPGLPEHVRAQVLATDAWSAQHADVVSAVSSTLHEEKQRANPETHWLPNAVDTDLFMRPRESWQEPPELRGVSHPVLAFVGGLNDWMHDWKLLDGVATLRPGWTVLLIGGLDIGGETRQMLARHSNILAVGQKPYQELPAYLAYSDACFQFYRPIRKNNSGNSQKLFLYFASGKPIVSTPSADVGVYSDKVQVVDTPHAFVAGVERALAEDTPEAKDARLEMARQNSWAARAEQIQQIMQKKMAR